MPIYLVTEVIETLVEADSEKEVRDIITDPDYEPAYEEYVGGSVKRLSMKAQEYYSPDNNDVNVVFRDLSGIHRKPFTPKGRKP